MVPQPSPAMTVLSEAYLRLKPDRVAVVVIAGPHHPAPHYAEMLEQQQIGIHHLKAWW